jgi:transposase
MPLELSLLKIEEFEILNISGLDPIEITAKYIGKNCCPHCGGFNLRKKDLFIRKLEHESFGTRRSKLLIKAFKFKCLSCLKYFNQRLPGVLPYKRSTEAFRKEVFLKHHQGICQSTLSKHLYIGTATIERWYHELLQTKINEYSDYPCPKVIGIDEHFFTKKDGYSTTVIDLSKHRVYDLYLGRSELALQRPFNALKGKDQVKVVVMDLSETYRNISKIHFPRALIVADRFHVIRLINHHFLKSWQLIDPIGRKNRGLLSLMRRHDFNLSDKQKGLLEKYFQTHPEIKPIYEFKQRLNHLLLIKHQTKRQCKKLIPIFLEHIQFLLDSMIEPLVTLGKTLRSWSEEVARMWRFTKSNGITEGFHNKMETISRRAYGFKNFENYRLRVRALCSKI